jgi:hypothetical protein
VKGRLDACRIERVALMPMGEGDFIMAVNAIMRKEIRKNVGATIKVELAMDNTEIKPPAALIECLKDEPAAWAQYQSLHHRTSFTLPVDRKRKDGRNKSQAHCADSYRVGRGQRLRCYAKKLKERRDEIFINDQNL